MGRINNTTMYPLDEHITENDYVIGTDGDNNRKTKNFSFKSIGEFAKKVTLDSLSFTQDLDNNTISFMADGKELLKLELGKYDKKSEVTEVLEQGNIIAKHNDGHNKETQIKETITNLTFDFNNGILKYVNENSCESEFNLLEFVKQVMKNTIPNCAIKVIYPDGNCCEESFGRSNDMIQITFPNGKCCEEYCDCDDNEGDDNTNETQNTTNKKGTEYLKITTNWYGNSDQDNVLIQPNKDFIIYDKRKASGFIQDIDDLGTFSGVDKPNIENIIKPFDSLPQEGEYIFHHSNYNRNDLAKGGCVIDVFVTPKKGAMQSVLTLEEIITTEEHFERVKGKTSFDRLTGDKPAFKFDLKITDGNVSINVKDLDTSRFKIVKQTGNSIKIL